MLYASGQGVFQRLYETQKRIWSNTNEMRVVDTVDAVLGHNKRRDEVQQSIIL